ncbi:unnamed protein product [Pocillopora meandrina]|uniref:Uncharacterized protein n=1 Tax=Pocillopora meandrina TaxID=46732 RepID=A0AAU9XNQ5_9CNID|nr:unnamed protein product [Pocillopora meandrina]
MVKRELVMIAGGLSLKYGRYIAVASAALLTAKMLNTSQVTSNDENKTKPNQDPGRVADGKKLSEDSRRVREERRRKEGAGTTGVGLQPEPSSFSITQILSVASVVLSLAGLYYKRK